ncbi:MAG: hypothetical protein J0L92_29160 [Deltaproteobacteria bacterium]|nr:hypothetical protein [Deltaproteobacteria bacterium]
MQHRLEIAPSGRATCRTCNQTIAKGDLRLGEEYASQFGADGFAVRWHHLPCAAKKIPDVLREAMASYEGDIPGREALETTMNEKPVRKSGTGALPSADLAPTGRAKCMKCQEAIEKGTVRIGVERELDTGAFTQKSAGYLHPHCAEAWADEGWESGFADLIEQVKKNTGLAALPPPFGDASPEAIAALSETDAKPKKAPKKPAKASEEGAKASEDDSSASERSADGSEGTAKKKASRAKEPAADAGPAFGSMTGKQVTALAAKLAKIDEDYKSDAVFEKSGIEWAQRDALRWHIARHHLLPATHPTLLHRMAESASQASADDVFAVVPQLGEPLKKASTVDVLPGWSLDADLIVLRAHELDPARLEALLPEASPRLRLGIQLARGRSGAEVPAEDRRGVLEGLAEIEAKDWGMAKWTGVNGSGIVVKALAEGGARTQPYASSAALAASFGTEAEWLAALARAAKAARFGTLEHVLPALATMPLEEMVALIAKPHFSSSEQHDALIAKLVEQRDDDPAALVKAALTIGREDYPGMYVREQLLVHGLGRLAARGLPIPEGLEREPKWDGFAYCVAPWRGSKVMRAAYRRALEGLGRERTLALTQPILERSYGHSQALPFLAVHFDEAIARRLVAERADQGIADPDAFAALGAPALPLLLEAIESAPDTSPDDKKRRDALVKCLRGTLGFVGATGGTFDASLDRFVSCAPEESYWREEAKVILVHTLRALPEARRVAVLERLLEETKQIERAFLGVQTVTDPAFRARAARKLVERYGQVADKHTLQTGLQALLPDGLQAFRAALVELAPDAKLFEQLAFVFGHADVEALRAAANVATESDLARLMRLAAAYLAANVGAPKERIYLLERRDLETDAPARRAASFSSSRGKGPSGLSHAGQPPALEPGKIFSLGEVLAMKQRAAPIGEDDEHIVTIDLEEIPELAARHPGARALALFAPAPSDGDGWDRGHLVAVPATATPPTDGTPLSVVPLDVPSAIFDAKAASDAPALKEIRGLVFNRPGYVLGQPMFIQDEEESGVSFVMQLSERIGDLNLGDSGSLYVFDDAIFMQCY